MSGLEITLLYLIAAVLGVALFRYVQLPAMLGYLAVGVVIGPNALALAGDPSTAQHLAEFGVVFLMFSIGLEFSLAKIQAMRRLVFGLGSAQVGATIAAVLAGSLLLGWLAPQWWTRAVTYGVVLGGAMAMSSTAIVVKLLADRLEMESEHGRHIVGVLLFQDLAVVPLLVLIPALAQPADSHLAMTLGWAAVKAAAALALILMAGGRLLRPWLKLVVKRKSDELFMLNLLLITLGLAWLTQLAGLSLALGAFLAGMLIAETEFRYQVEADIRPFRDVLLGLFFITIGMLLDWRIVLAQWWLVLLLALLPLLLKTAIVFGVERLLKSPPGLSLRTALWLAPAGEFGIVLLNLAAGRALLPPELFSPVLAAMVLSMLAAPFLAQHIDRIVLKLVANEWMLASLQLTNIARQTIKTQRHVVVCGFGRCGQNLAQLLQDEAIPYVALDLDPDRVSRARTAGRNVVYGDAARLFSLQAAGLARASAVAITYVDKRSALRVLQLVREHAPRVPVVVRTRDDSALDELRAAGAAEVVPEILEGSLMLASQTMAVVGVPLPRVLTRLRAARAERYGLLRDYFHGIDDANTPLAEPRDQPRLKPLTLPAGARAVGSTLAELDLHGAHVAQIHRADGHVLLPLPELMLAEGDTLVLSGPPEALALAEDALLGGD
ncbi:monovalent cation:proton antiporter family protein [Thiomonas sp.]|uniref:monovalent cation:proton antiporter family protein n=1 Tax=Thiomonas sp. TaxID=2047785 RepID=UPI0025906F7F|nr:monovalent cation:proton antiporter family protein [Thiomonas sp.]